MTTAQIDYRELEFVGYDKSPSGLAVLHDNQRNRLLFRRESTNRDEWSNILTDRQEISVSRADFDAQMQETEKRIVGITGDWRYKNVINFDTTELDQLRAQHASMQVLREQIDSYLRPYSPKGVGE